MLKLNYDKIIFLADIHFGVHKNKFSYLDSQQDYFLNFFIPLVKKQKQQNKNIALFILGDVFESRETINLRVLHESREIFKLLSEIIDIYILLGNHDIYNVNSNNISSLDAFFGLEHNKHDKIEYNNIHVWKTPEQIRVKDKTFYVLPWVHKKDEFKELIDSDNSDYLLSHCDINELKLNRYSSVDYGIEVKQLRKYKKIFSGHIHYRQEHKNIYMVGCPQSTKFSDLGNDKGIYILDVDNDTTEFIKNDYSPIHIELNLDEYFVNQKEFLNKVNGNYLQLIIQQSTISNSPSKFDKAIKDIGSVIREIKPIIENDIEQEIDPRNEQYKEIYSFDKILEKVIDNSGMRETYKINAKVELAQIIGELKIDIDNEN